MRIFYNTNGFAHHRLRDALAVLEAAGYDGVSLTLDVLHADLEDPGLHLDFAVELLRDSPLAIAIETGGRYVLDPLRKHRPNLLDEGAPGDLRLDFYKRAVDFAVQVDSPLVSLWSGALPDGEDLNHARERLVERTTRLLQHARSSGVRIAMEPEPGMLVETLGDFDQLVAGDCMSDLALTCDLGHLYCSESPPYPDLLLSRADRLVNVHVDDIAGGRHEHLELGAGDIDFLPLLSALDEVGYDGPLSVELSRSSHRAVEAAQNSIVFLKNVLSAIPSPSSPR